MAGKRTPRSIYDIQTYRANKCGSLDQHSAHSRPGSRSFDPRKPQLFQLVILAACSPPNIYSYKRVRRLSGRVLIHGAARPPKRRRFHGTHGGNSRRHNRSGGVALQQHGSSTLLYILIQASSHPQLLKWRCCGSSIRRRASCARRNSSPSLCPCLFCCCCCSPCPYLANGPTSHSAQPLSLEIPPSLVNFGFWIGNRHGQATSRAKENRGYSGWGRYSGSLFWRL